MATVYLVAKNRFCTSLCLAKEVVIDKIVPISAIQQRGIMAHLADKVHKVETNPVQDPSTTHTNNYLAIFAHKV